MATRCRPCRVPVEPSGCRARIHAFFVEGPWWSGNWTAISVATLEQLGHTVTYHYHNRRTLTDRIALAAGKLAHPAEPRSDAWTRRYQSQLFQAMHGAGWDMLFSIQGRVQANTIQQLRSLSPGLRVVYWWGDIITDQASRRLADVAKFSDHILISHRGAYDKLKAVYGDKITYFSFGVSSRTHQIDELSWRDRQRYTADVAFVGTCYPERCELVRYLNTRLENRSVFGGAVAALPGCAAHGPLPLADTLKVYACSGISLNLHHRDTDNGCNMKFLKYPPQADFRSVTGKLP